MSDLFLLLPLLPSPFLHKMSNLLLLLPLLLTPFALLLLLPPFQTQPCLHNYKFPLTTFSPAQLPPSPTLLTPSYNCLQKISNLLFLLLPLPNLTLVSIWKISFYYLLHCPTQPCLHRPFTIYTSFQISIYYFFPCPTLTLTTQDVNLKNLLLLLPPLPNPTLVSIWKISFYYYSPAQPNPAYTVCTRFGWVTHTLKTSLCLTIHLSKVYLYLRKYVNPYEPEQGGIS